MYWRIKVVGFKLLSGLPGGSALYRFSQKHITKSLVLTRNRALQKVKVGTRYFEWLTDNDPDRTVAGGVHLDFGSGWHPTIPLLFHTLGVRRQHLFDIKPILDRRMLQQTVSIFREIQTDPDWPRKTTPSRALPDLANLSLSEYLDSLGTSYHAPYAEQFSTLARTVDLVTSTQVLFHVPRTALASTFKQIFGVLKPGGHFMATIHLQDILAGSPNNRVAKFHQFRYSPETWNRWFSSDLMSYNRLRAPDYLSLLKTAGFQVRHFEVEPGTEADHQALERTPIAECFKHYSWKDLAARHLFFVAQKP